MHAYFGKKTTFLHNCYAHTIFLFCKISVDGSVAKTLSFNIVQQKDSLSDIA